ncbi:MAG: DUF4827 family protein [Porphyromonas sp.]|nr:DUF4827 family protein [Porphyromonas sp.]
MNTTSRIAYGLCLTLLLGGVGLSLSSCSKSTLRSLIEMKQDERKQVKKFISEKGFKVREVKSGQTRFTPGILYHFDNDLYMEVLDHGGDRAIPNETHVFVRMKGYTLNRDGYVEFDCLSKSKYQPIEFIYIDAYKDGPLHYKSLPPAAGYNLNRYLCEGLAFPMSLLGDGARVRLIVPFSIGPESMVNGGIPTYFEEVEYTF